MHNTCLCRSILNIISIYSNNSLTALNLTDYLVYFFFLIWCSFKNKCNLGGGGGVGFRVIICGDNSPGV